MQNSTLVWIIVIALVILGAGWYLFSNQPIAPAVDQNSGQNQGMLVPGNPEGLDSDTEVNIDVGASVGTQTAPTNAAVTYSSSGFSPSSVTIKKGGTVTWQNQGSGGMWVASASHPTHTAYSGTTLGEHCDTMSNDSLDQCKTATTYSFTFEKAGTWRYHNHSQSSHFGTVIVVE